MGGHMQPQGHLQVVSHLVDRGLDPQAALDEPRWRLDTGGRGEWELALEEPLYGLAPALARRGHRVVCDPNSVGFGGGQAVLVRDDVLIGGSEPRKDGVALGY
jgi:gamma-glutamyltranspeptidase/glutathione hydrolase